MKIADVAKLTPMDRFVYWIRERHQIYLKRKYGKPKPWTDDEVLQSYFFTNPYRENDKTTVWFRENVRELLRNDPQVLFATVCFRWFNLISTGVELMDGPIISDNCEGCLLLNWDTDEALRRLGAVRDEGRKVFTGAFMINSPGGEPKLEAICRRINAVWEAREHLTLRWDDEVTMEGFHSVLTDFEGLGGFMAYEIVCDLRYTYLLENAPDKMTWCNPGPGAIRGLYRIAGEKIVNKSNSTSPPKPKNWQARMAGLLGALKRRLPKMPPFEMREVEHSLCEFDKYSRALVGDGRMKRTYNRT